MRQLWLRSTGKISNGQGYLEDTMIGPGRQPEAGDGLVEEIGRGLIETAEPLDLLGIHLGIAVQSGRVGKALPLATAGFIDPGADSGRRFARWLPEQFVNRNRRHFKVDVNPIKQGAGKTTAVPLHLHRRTTAVPELITEIAAGARVRYLLQNRAGTLSQSKTQYPKALEKQSVTHASWQDGPVKSWQNLSG
jgi:hypothetical protein